MPILDQVAAIGPYTLGVGVLANVTGLVTSDSSSISADVQYQERPSNTAEFSQSTVQTNTIEVSFKYGDNYTAKANLLRALNFPQNTAPVRLQVYQGDETALTLCYADVAAQSINQSQPGEIRVTYARADPYWRAVAATNLSDTASNTDRSFTAAGAIILHNEGHVRVGPTYRLQPTAQRTTFTSAQGWRYRRQVTIQNTSGQNWYDEPICIDLGDTAAWVTASKALASGDDVAPVVEGEMSIRTLTNFNTKRTFLWMLITLPDDESTTIDIWYGNPATSSNQTPNLSTRTGEDQTYVAFDIRGYNGTATAGSSSTLTDSGAAHETDRWAGGFIQITSGTGSGQRRRIASNTGTVITVNRNFSTAPDNTSTYCIWMSGVFADGGRVTSRTASTITDNAHTTKWGVNELEGATVTFFGGSGATPSTMTVLSNTTDTLTFTSSFSVQPAVNDSYYIERLGVWSYVVDTALTETLHRGLYRENRYYTPPSRIWSNGDTPGGWQVDTYLPNGDDFAQFKPYDVGSGGGHAQNWWPLLRARRRRGQERTYKNEGNGDGLSLFSAFGFQACYFDWQVKNVNGVGKAVFATQESGGENWVDVVSYTTTHATLTNVAAQWADLSGYESPTHLGMFALPADTDEQGNIPSTAKDNDEVEVRNNDVLRVILNLDAFGGLTASRYVVGSEAEIYDLGASLRIGGGNETDKTPPYDVITFGGEGHKLGLLLTEEVWVTVDPSIGRPLIAIYDTLGDTLRPAAWGAVIDSYALDVDGNAEAIVAMELASLPAGVNLVDNGTFASTDVSMWTMTPSSGVTAAKAYSSSAHFSPNGSLEVNITAAPAGPWDVTLTLPTIDVLPGMAYPFGFYRITDNNGSSVKAEMTVSWQGGTSGDTDQTIGGTFAANNVWYHDADSNYTYDVPPGMVGLGDPVTQADISIVISGSGSFVGKVRVSAVTLGIPAVHVTEDDMGTLRLDAVWREAYLG